MNEINKTGIVKQINGNELKINILSCSACSSCAVKGFCLGSESKEKEIIVKTDNAKDFKINDEVIVTITENQAFQAIVLAYVIPLILMISTIIGVLHYKQGEITGGICGIIILIPYYFGLFLAKDKVKSKFEFKVSKKDVR